PHSALPSFPTRRSSDLDVSGADRCRSARLTRAAAASRTVAHRWVAKYLGLASLRCTQILEILDVPHAESTRIPPEPRNRILVGEDRKSTRLNSSHLGIS